MANLHLVTGYAGREHVTAADQGAFNVAMLGSGQFVMDKGKKLAASIVSNNQIRVLDGDIYMQGRFIRLNEGSYADLVIENGTQGYQRNDLIVARYTKAVETGIEEVNLVVIKGTAVASNPKDPSYSNGNIIEGKAYLNDMPLYRVTLSGLTIQSLVPLFIVKNCTVLMRDGSNAMTGALGVNDNHGNVNANANRAQLRFNPDPNDTSNATSMGIYNPANGLNELARIYTIINGEEKQYNIHHSGNKPTGSYTGNGSATERKIQIGGIGKYLLIHADTFNNAIITPNGRINFVFSTGTAKVGDGAKFENGVLTLTTEDGGVNANGRVFHYQVL